MIKKNTTRSKASSFPSASNSFVSTRLISQVHQDMAVKPTVALRAILVGGIAAFAKIGGVMKAAGGVKLGAAAAAVTAAATAAVSSKPDQKDAPHQS
ncbi:uncharacterized protein LOC115691079 [Syzygium oleosum]|uniref:uncharacterized protein LOC115691079 n=1 Tax=Syzygium oleosum TaxID=219896 RepID=UPI0011D1D83C|nr:uncharacterized protein LOC115691079 [Syzygium oleosum]